MENFKTDLPNNCDCPSNFLCVFLCISEMNTIWKNIYVDIKSIMKTFLSLHIHQFRVHGLWWFFISLEKYPETSNFWPMVTGLFQCILGNQQRIEFFIEHCCGKYKSILTNIYIQYLEYWKTNDLKQKKVSFQWFWNIFDINNVTFLLY